MKRLAALILAATLCLPLAACSKGGSGGADGDGETYTKHTIAVSAPLTGNNA